MQAAQRRMTGKPAKSGGLQDMINAVTAENSPGASPVMLQRIVEYINRSPDRGSEKALKYLRNRFLQKHVKVQNLTLIVLETCMKRCGHMFREKLPFSDLWAELMKVATLKRKADVQIYNKILALVEDWSEAIDLPAYRAALAELKGKAVRFPNRPVRDLSEYKEGGTMNALGQPQALPPGSSSALRAEFNGPNSPGVAGGSPGNSKASTPYAYGGNGHFAPSPPKAPPGNVASVPEDHLSPGQSDSKLRDDLLTAKNSADLLAEMLAPITLAEAAQVKQDHVTELAGECEAMLPRLAALAEQVTDEDNLNQTLTIHADMEESLLKYRNLVEVAEGTAPAAAAAPPQPPSPPADEPHATQPSLLDFDDDSNYAPAVAAASSAAAVGAVNASAPPQQSPNPHDLLADLFGPPLLPNAAPAGPQPGGAPPQPQPGQPPLQKPTFNWNGPVPQVLPDPANPFGVPDQQQQQQMSGASQGFAAFTDAAAFGPAGPQFSGPPALPQVAAPPPQSSQPPPNFGPPDFSQAPPNFGGPPPQPQPQPQFSQGFSGQPAFSSQPPPSFSQAPSFGPPPPQPFGFSPQQPAPQGFAPFSEASAFGGPPAFGGPAQQPGPFGGPSPFGAPPTFVPQGGFGPPPNLGGFSGGYNAPPPFSAAPPFQAPPALPAAQQPQAPTNASFGGQPAFAKTNAYQTQQPPKTGSPSFTNHTNNHSSGLIAAVKADSPGRPGPPVPAASANPFDDPPAASMPTVPVDGKTGQPSKLQPPQPNAPKAAHPPLHAGGAAPKPSWPPPAEADPFADLASFPRH